MTSLSKIITLIIWSVVIVFFVSGESNATIYFYFDAEDSTVGDTLPYDQSSGYEFCQPLCGSSNGVRGYIANEGGTPQGDKYFRWDLNNTDPNSTKAIFCNLKNKDTFPVNLELGKTYYIAFFCNFTRIDGQDIWHSGGEGFPQSADKGIEMKGSGIRWIAARGQWEEIDNDLHKWSVWMGNPTYHLNPDLEEYYPNTGGFERYVTAPQLEYESWHSIVFGVKIATDSTGSIVLYLNGNKVIDYSNIKTTDTSNPTISVIYIDGTIAQPEYDAPAHIRKYDALMLTDDWQDIVDGGYLETKTTISEPLSPLPAPAGLVIE